MAAPHRRVRTQPPRKELLVLVEGAVTEEAYLLFWKRQYRQLTLVDVHEFRGTPMSLVEKAVELKAAEEREARRGRGRAHDEIWCVFDVDAHLYLHEAIALAAAEGINVAISNPCIELWFLLHFVDQRAYIDRHAAQKAAKAALGCDKQLTSSALERMADNFETAKARARNLDDKHFKDDTPAPGNPSSGAWRLIDSIADRD